MSQTARADVLAQVAIRLAGADGHQLDDAISKSLATVGFLTGSQRVYVTEFHDDETLSTGYEWLADGVVPHRGAIQRISTDKYRYSANLARSGQIMLAPNLDHLPTEAASERESFGSFGINAVLQVPVLVEGRLVMVLGVNHTQAIDGWTDDTIETVQLIATAIGIALNRRQADARLRRALQAAERANRAKDDLIARAGHELRTPLHAIIGFAEILQLDGVNNEALAQIQSSSGSLLEMVDELLDLGRLTVQDGELKPRRPVSEILAEVFTDLADTAKAKAVQLTLNMNGSSRVVTSPLRVHQVLHCVTAAAITMAGHGGQVDVQICSPDDRCIAHLSTTGPSSTEPAGLAFALAESFIDDLSGTINWKSSTTDTGVTTTEIELVVDQADSL